MSPLKITLFHNPRCSKSREALQLLKENNSTVEVVEYLKNPLNFNEIKELVNLLGVSPIQIIRKGEPIFKEQFSNKSLSDTEWIQALVDFPILIERPIAIHGKKAVIGRPPVLVLDIL